MKLVISALFASILVACSTVRVDVPTTTTVKPIHLDDIHFIVTDEDAAVAFFMDHFGAREMAHPGTRFELVRFLSLKWQGPTITITRIGPYDDLPASRNQRWLDAQLVLPSSEKAKPVFGARWLAIATPSLEAARRSLVSGGVEISEPNVALPMEPDTPAFSIYGPDGAEIVIVERPQQDFGKSSFKIDHIQFLAQSVPAHEEFFARVFDGKATERAKDSSRVRVADIDLVISEPAALGIPTASVAARRAEGTIRIGLDHLGFLYESIASAVENADRNGVAPIFAPQRYLYRGEPTVYTFTAFSTPDGFNVEMVQADGRVGPHSYYLE